jgi:hypothetical protein
LLKVPRFQGVPNLLSGDDKGSPVSRAMYFISLLGKQATVQARRRLGNDGLRLEWRSRAPNEDRAVWNGRRARSPTVFGRDPSGGVTREEKGALGGRADRRARLPSCYREDGVLKAMQDGCPRR